MTGVPFLDLGRLHASIRPEIDAAIEEVLTSSAFVSGSVVQSFEAAFGTAHGLGPGASCGSGTDALALALRALGVGPGDDVIVPSMTFVATAEAVVHVGARPVVADVDPRTLLLSPVTVDAARTLATRAVIAVHLYGHMVEPDAMQSWRNDGLKVVEDAAQAHLAHAGDVGVGAVGDAACFSFYPGKNLGALGDGGMVLSTDDGLCDEVRRLRDHGRSSKYLHDAVGWCSRLDGLQAAVLRAKLTHLPDWTAARRRLAALYQDRLGDLLVPWSDGAVHHLLVCRVGGRETVQDRLASLGIGTGVHYPVPLSKQPWLVASGARPCPAAEAAAAEILSLPMDPLMRDDEVRIVTDALQEFLGGGG